MPEFSIRGGRDTATLAAHFQEIGRRGMRTEMEGALLVAAQPLVVEARHNAAAKLPKRGGLGKTIAGSTITVDPLAHLGVVGVRITVFGHDPSIDRRGYLRHPVFGHDWWAPQKVAPGWFTDAMRHGAEAGKAALALAVEKQLSRV